MSRVGYECKVCGAGIDYTRAHSDARCDDCIRRDDERACKGKVHDLLAQFDLYLILRVLSKDAEERGKEAHSNGKDEEAGKWWRIGTDLYALSEDAE